MAITCSVENKLKSAYNAGAASRWIEHQRHDSLFEDLLSYKLAGEEGRSQPMGEWIMVISQLASEMTWLVPHMPIMARGSL